MPFSGRSSGGFKGRSRSGGNRGRSSGGFRRSFGPRQMFKIKCSECGADAEVPFKPREGTPVYCRDCFMKKKGITPKPKEEIEEKEEFEEEPTEEASEEEFKEDFEESEEEEEEF